MGYRWVLATILICPMSAGCLRDGGKASPPAVESPSKLPSGKTAEANVSIYYHLPLIIELDAPAVPPEIERPSPPIPDRVKTF